MPAYSWIKLYDDILDDPKMGRLSDGAYRFCINLFLLAGRQESRDGRLPSLEDVAWMLRLQIDDARGKLAELLDAGIVEMTDDERPFVAKFASRQEAITAKERMAQYRSRAQKAKSTSGKRQPATPQVTTNERNSYDTVTKRNTDIDIDIDKEYIYTPAHDKVAELITDLIQVVKNRYSIKDNQEWEDAAFELIGRGATPEQLTAFGEWWSRNGYYTGKPAIKSLLQEWPNFTAGVETKHVDKQQLANDAWDVVCRNGRRGYQQARQQLNGQWKYIEQMGKWANVCDMNEQTFRIKFFEAMNKVNNGQ